MTPRNGDSDPLPEGWEVAGYIDYTRNPGDRYFPGDVTQADLDAGYSVRVSYRAPGESSPSVWRTIHGPLIDYDQIGDLIEDMMDHY